MGAGNDHDQDDHHEQECCHHDHHKPRHCTPITKCRDIYLKIEARLQPGRSR